MIATITLNSAIDRTYYVNGFAAGGVHRVARKIDEPGGKGNNVAKVARQLGSDVTASGFTAGGSGAFIEERLAERGIGADFVRIDGESRVCLNIVDETNGASTELLEAGPAVAPQDIERLKATVRALAARNRVVAMSGSLPPGAPASLYAELIGIVREAGALAFLDTSGAAFAAALPARPDAIKPNEQELAAWAGRESLSEEEVVAAALRLSQDVPNVCVTLGGRGAIAVLDGRVFRVTPPAIRAVNTVGCGDAFVAGLAVATARGVAPEERLRLAAAAAAANALSERAGDADPARVRELAAQVGVVPLS